MRRHTGIRVLNPFNNFEIVSLFTPTWYRKSKNILRKFKLERLNKSTEIENNWGKHFHTTHCHGQTRTRGYVTTQSNWCHLLTKQFTIPSPLHQRPPSRFPHPGCQDPHPNSLFLLSLLWLVLEAHQWDRNRKDIIKHWPAHGVPVCTADTDFKIRNTKPHILHTLIQGAKTVQSAVSLPSGSVHAKRFHTDKWYQLSPIFKFSFLQRGARVMLAIPRGRTVRLTLAY